MSTQYEIFQHFNISKRRDLVKSQTYQATRNRILSAVHDRAWIAFAAPIGSGKTETVYGVVDELARDPKRRIIEVLSPDRQGIKIAHVMNSIIYQIGTEFSERGTSPRRDMEARTMQVLNILSAAKKKGIEVIVTIDEAHELHGNTLKAIKRLREFRFRGEKDLMTVILVGQEALASKLSRDDEVGLRCDCYEFAYTRAELAEIARHHSYGMLDADEARTVAEAFGTPLAIHKAIMDAMRKAHTIDAPSIELKHFDWPDSEAKQAPKRSPRKKIDVKAGAAGKLESKMKNVS